MWLFAFVKRVFLRDSPPENTDALFFGLGNIGKRYARTRHTIGFRIADAIAERLGNGAGKTGFFAAAEYRSGTLFHKIKVLTIKPHTLMNRSGDAVARYIERKICPLDRTLVIVDDYNLPLGKLRFRRTGGDGGHNGLKSIIGRIGENFPRFRVGIGPLPDGIAGVDFVLGSFTNAEEDVLKTVIPEAVEACMLFAENGIEAAMNKFNK